MLIAPPRLTPPDPPPAGWNYRRENARGRPQSGEAKLLRWPFPYRAAFALSNDTDGMRPPALADLHDFVNGTGETPYGPGCGLEVGDSFWIWCETPQLSLRLGVPRKRSLPKTQEHDLLVELGRAGWLDTLHGFGDWTEPWRIGRREAEAGMKLLDRAGIKPSVYVNHGNSRPVPGGGRTMSHNFSGPWGWYQRADVRGDRSYCLDLLLDAGVRFFWHDVCFELEKFGEDRVYRNQRGLDREVVDHDFRRWFRHRPPEGEGPFEHAFPELPEEDVLALRERFFNRLVFPIAARDGRNVLCFKRFRGLHPPTAGNFASQVTGVALDELEAREAGVVVYQHFGVWRPLGAGKDHPMEQTAPPILDAHAQWAFRELAHRQRDGRIFVTTTSRLLRFAWVRDHLAWRSTASEDVLVLRLLGVSCPAYGTQRLDHEMLQGLSFAIPHGSPEVRLEVRGLSNPPRLERRPHSEDNTVEVVTIPWRRLEWQPITPIVAAFS
jgi:hypothetical protein